MLAQLENSKNGLINGQKNLENSVSYQKFCQLNYFLGEDESKELSWPIEDDVADVDDETDEEFVIEEHNYICKRIFTRKREDDF